jgi:hypothetical protein
MRRYVLALASLALLMPSPAGAVTVSRRVPTTFGIGVAASVDSKTMLGWMPRTGAPLDYAYRYLGGGVGTGHNWTDMAAGATYPITYATQAVLKGYTPVFTYYNLLSTPGPCAASCVEAQRDLTNLNAPAVMNAYFADFALLMQRLGAGWGGDTIVHVEPDLSGYANLATLNPTAKCYGFCTGTGNDPRLLRASVASSGYALASGMENTYKGFNLTLARIRDTYAPNVRLAMHVSNWATGWDLNSATDPTIDATDLGVRAGTFALASGAASFDLLFNDVSNKDAAYYTYVLHKARFWDQDNAVFPNFHRWESYVKAVTTTTGKKAIVWQVPIGNQLYKTMNNTYGHWQDNRVEYFFNHLAELRDAGLIGVLFGTTQPDATNYWDAAGDVVTNPAPVCTSDGWSSGKVVCSTLDSPSADDDGTYLRLRVIDYYKNPLPLG